MQDYQQSLLEITRQAGEIIMGYRDKYGKTSEKEKNEIVTSADIASNEFIINQLKSLYPSIEIYTEEQTDNKSNNLTRWIVDPLDGTTAWVWGNSGFAVSIALELNGEVTVGAVYDPVMQEFFYAEKDQGATRNGKTISPQNDIPIEQSFMVVDWGYKGEKSKEGIKYFEKFWNPQMFARRIVPQWAPALGLCRIAEGRIHALVCNDTWVEDHSAGSFILQEAGGFCTNFYHTESFNHREFGIIATNEKGTHSEIVSFLRSHSA